MDEREGLRAEFLNRCGLSDARREGLAGDASTRRYERLWLADGSTRIFMDQPPVESEPCAPDADPQARRQAGYNAVARLAAGRIEAFICAGAWLRSLGLSTPEVMAQDTACGFAVLEDLGDDLYATLISAGQDETPLYDAAIDALARIHETAPPAVLQGPGGLRWPLLDYDELALGIGGEMFLEWWPRYSGGAALSTDAAAEWEALIAPVLQRGAQGASVFCHRDYHAENLLWLPGREGLARVGMLDFQDAVRAHPAWDLSMLLHDGRRDVSTAREAACLDRYFQARPQVDRDSFMADYHALGALNCARILFIFARQVAGYGKPKYKAFIPRMWGYLERCLSHPGLTGLESWFARNVPADARR